MMVNVHFFFVDTTSLLNISAQTGKHNWHISFKIFFSVAQFTLSIMHNRLFNLNCSADFMVYYLQEIHWKWLGY